MKFSTFIIILLIVMNCFTLHIALGNRDAIVSTFNMFDTLSSAFETEQK